MKNKAISALENRTDCVPASVSACSRLRLPRKERAPRLSAGCGDIEQ